jgi:orotate phosphoribosyltransferase
VLNQKKRLAEILERSGAVQHLPEPIQLASGGWSRDFIDGKLAVSEPDDFAFVGSAMSEACTTGFEAVGGLVLGAAPFTFAVFQAARCKWFLVRKEPKGRGTNRWIEGARITSGTKVMLVDDVITTGGSIKLAFERVTGEGAQVVFATTLVDRGDEAAGFFDDAGVPYVPMLTYRDLGIPPVISSATS